MTDEPANKPTLQLKSQKFREAREGEWRALSGALDKVEKQGLRSFSVEDILNLPLLYRQAVSSLSMAQSISLDRNLVTYLQALCARAYVFIYAPHTRFQDMASGYFTRAWPRGVRTLLPDIALSLVVTVIGVLIGWLMCAHDSSWYDMFVPAEMAQGRNLAATVKDLAETVGSGPMKSSELPTMAAMLMTHNTQVCVVAFAMGAIFGLPTLISLIYNGSILGAMMWLFWSRGLGFDFTAWIMIHGTTELLAIVIAGGCGFHIARRIMFPGDATRLRTLAEAGRTAGSVMIGVAIMLIIAGCLEGIGRQTIVNGFARMGVGLFMLTLWALYFTFVGRSRAGEVNGG